MDSVKSMLESLKTKIPTETAAQGYNINDLTVLEGLNNMFIKIIETYNNMINTYNDWAFLKYDLLELYTPIEYQELKDLDQNGIKSITAPNFIFIP